MDRKAFFKRLLFGISGIVFAKLYSPASSASEIVLSHPLIAGFHYYDGYKTEKFLCINSPLVLKRQPGNAYDKNAVEVFFGTAKLGYLPRRENKIIARMLDQGVEVKARIVQVAPEKDAYERIRLEVYLPNGTPVKNQQKGI